MHNDYFETSPFKIEFLGRRVMGEKQLTKNANGAIITDYFVRIGSKLRKVDLTSNLGQELVKQATRENAA